MICNVDAKPILASTMSRLFIEKVRPVVTMHRGFSFSFLFLPQLDRFASIRIPGSKKERTQLSHMAKQSCNDWSTSSEFDDLSSRITSEKEILALFEKMMVSVEVLLYMSKFHATVEERCFRSHHVHCC